MNHFPIFNIYYSVIDIKTQFFFLVGHWYSRRCFLISRLPLNAFSSFCFTSFLFSYFFLNSSYFFLSLLFLHSFSLASPFTSLLLSMVLFFTKTISCRNLWEFLTIMSHIPESLLFSLSPWSGSVSPEDVKPILTKQGKLWYNSHLKRNKMLMCLCGLTWGSILIRSLLRNKQGIVD